MDMKHGNAALTGHMNMQHEQSTDMQHGDTDMQH
jgi:hypothetical protein